MSDLRKISDDELKAPAGQFRVVQINEAPEAFGCSPEFFLVDDYPEKRFALDDWRARLQTRNKDTNYKVYADDGHVVDALGMHITEEERRAPPGKFRVIAADIQSRIIWLVADLDDKQRAIEYAKNAYEGPHTEFQVHDDTGATLIPL